MAFTYPLDIVNRGLQHLGIHRTWSLNTATDEANEANALYDDIRLAELQRNLWKFATRRVILRALGIDSITWTPPAWVSGTAYTAGAVVQYTPILGPYNGRVLNWQLSQSEASSTVAPDLDPLWSHYTGPLALDLWSTGDTGLGSTSAATDGVTYQSGEVVLVPATWSNLITYNANDVVAYTSGGVTAWYVSLINNNLNHNPSTAAADWQLWTSEGRNSGTNTWGLTPIGSPIPLTYPAGYSVYISLYNNNADNPTSGTSNWLSLEGTIAPLEIVWPIGSGPANETNTLNCYHLPNGFLERAPTDPKANIIGYLGAASGSRPEDWVIEGPYIVTGDSGPIMMRFVADIIDVPQMDAMFCEGVGARLATELAGTLAKENPQAKWSRAMATYRKVMADARVKNAIEIGPISPVENKYVNVRV